MRHWLPSFVGVLCLTLTSLAHALGMGEPSEISPLNRPLHVVLPLTAGDALEAGDITVRVADDGAYRRAGLTPSALGDTLVTRVERVNGSLAVMLDSDRRVREPFMDLLLVVTWPQGQWQRQVSLLFDPADYASAASLLRADSGAAVSSPATTLPARNVTSRAGASSPSEGASWSVDSESGGSEGGIWPATLAVRSGSTLFSLADTLAALGVSRQAAMLALYEANPSAFVDADIDRLRAGTLLDVPARSDIADIEASAARARLSALRPSRGGAGGSETRGGEALGAADGDTGPEVAAGTAMASLQRRLTSLSAEAERQRAAISALTAERDRLRASLAGNAATGGPSEAGSALSAQAVSAADTLAVASLDRRGGANLQAVNSGESSGASAGESTMSDASSAPGDSAGLPSPVRAAEASTSAPLPTASSASWLGLLAEQTPWLGAALLLVLLLFWWRQRRSQDEARDRPQVRAVAAESSETAAGPMAAPRASRDNSRSGTGGALDVDSASISQADIYIAYGRHAEARDWLRQKLDKREDARLRLSLLRALGELREMDAMEDALMAMGEGATRQQRQQGQEIVDTYRARYVDESWEEAVGEEAGHSDLFTGDEVDRSQDLTGADTHAAEPTSQGVDVSSLSESRDPVDSLFDSAQETGPESQPEPEPEPEPQAPAQTDSASRPEPVSLPAAAPDLAFEAEPIPEGPIPPHQASSADDDGSRRDASATIDYEPPTLEFESASSRLDVASRESQAKEADAPAPSVDFTSLSLRPLSGVDSVSDSSTGEHGAAFTLEDPAAPGVDDESGSSASWNTRGNETPGKGDERRRVPPAEWEIEEVEFETAHQDNGRP